jgi:hypothetical protein
MTNTNNIFKTHFTYDKDHVLDLRPCTCSGFSTTRVSPNPAHHGPDPTLLLHYGIKHVFVFICHPFSLELVRVSGTHYVEVGCIRVPWVLEHHQMISGSNVLDCVCFLFSFLFSFCWLPMSCAGFNKRRLSSHQNSV